MSPLRLLHWCLVGAYLLAPPTAVLWAARRARRTGRATAIVGVGFSAMSGMAIGIGLTAIYAAVGGAAMPVGQAALAGYFAVALIVLLKAFDAAVTAGASRAVGARGRGARRVIVQAGRVALLLGVGLPWVMAAVMVYRPKVLPGDDPFGQVGFDFEAVSFRAADGVELAGWWLPCQSGPSDRTVVVCHGLGAGKSNQLILAAAFAAEGFNALIFDFRGHGASGGQLSSFGNAERRDVRAAVDWARSNRPAESARLYGAGVSMGAAALLAAAADDERVEAVVAFSSFDRLDALAGDVARRTFSPPFDRYMAAAVVPLASLHAGTDLASFAPAEAIGRLWPRPVLVVHGGRDEVIPFARGRALYRAAAFPRQKLWLPAAGHDSTISDPGAVRAAREFLRTAERVPAI